MVSKAGCEMKTMQWGAVWENQGLGDAASLEDTIEEVAISRLILGIRATAGGPTAAQLKSAEFKLNYIRSGVDVELCDATIFDLAMLTDARGGYGRDWTDTDLTDVNVVLPMGLDLTSGGSLKVRFVTPDDVANTVSYCYYINDGSMPPTLKYTSQTTSGTASFKSALEIFSRNETGSYVDLEIEGEAKKSMPYALGRILFAEEAKIEKETVFAKIFSSTRPTALKIRASQGAATFFSIEVP